MNLTSKGYGRIYVRENDIDKVKNIILAMDKYEYEYLPSDLIAPFDQYPALVYTHKFDDLDMEALQAICWDAGIPILVVDNGHDPFATDHVGQFHEKIKDLICPYRVDNEDNLCYRTDDNDLELYNNCRFRVEKDGEFTCTKNTKWEL